MFVGIIDLFRVVTGLRVGISMIAPGKFLKNLMVKPIKKRSIDLNG